jgi:hypothetical protein
LVLIQLITELAIGELDKTGTEYISAINIPLSCALKSDSYSIISDASLVEEMETLCRWFGDTHVLPTNYRLAQISKQENNPNIAAFGFGAMGWNIVTYKNTPNNSLPILWFLPPGNAFRPPFERIDSRIGSPWAGRKNWLDRVEKDEKLRNQILEQLDLNRHN